MSIGNNDLRPAPSARILLVNDNARGLAARKKILEELGCSVTAQHCPSMALECFSAEPFDLVITGFRMPGMDGREFISEIRRKRPDQPIMLISGFADMLGLDEVSIGADVVIQKSAHEVEMMVRSVDCLLNRRKPARRAAGSYRPRSQGRAYAADQ